MTITPSYGIDSASFDVGGGVRVTQDQPMLRLRAETRWVPSDRFNLLLGTDTVAGSFTFEAELPFSFEDVASFDPLAERNPVSFGGEGYYYTPDIYLQTEIHPLKDVDRWVIYPEIRYGVGQIWDRENPDPLINVQGMGPSCVHSIEDWRKRNLKRRSRSVFTVTCTTLRSVATKRFYRIGYGKGFISGTGA